MRKRSCGNKTEVVREGDPREFNTSVCICPTQGPSLQQVTFPCSPEGLPAKEASTGSQANPPRPLGPSLGAAAPSRPLGAGWSSDPSRSPRHPFPASGAFPSPIPGLLRLHPRGLQSTSLLSLRTPPSPPSAPGPVEGAESLSFPSPASTLLVPTWRGPLPWPDSSASGRLPSPPDPAPLPGGYSLKPLRISLARSSLADMMRQLPPAALPRWPGGASQTVPRSRGLSRSPAWRPGASRGGGQIWTGLSLPSAPAPDPFSFPLALECPPQSQ